jgi:uncharacterized protein
MYQRFLEEKIKSTQLPVVFVNGARQVGKSTLVKKLFSHTHDYLTLDDPQILSLAKKDPLNFIRYAKGQLIIDEVQRCPELLLAIKIIVDEKRLPQQFILTGSVNVLRLGNVKDSLAGRMAVYTLWPLSQEEILNNKSVFLENLLTGQIEKKPLINIDLIENMKKGGYPLAILAEDKYHRHEWLGSYLTQILEKDIRDLSNIEGLSEIPNIIGLLASRVGSLLNVSELGRSLQIPHTTLKRYLSLLEMAYLFCPMQPWFKNLGKRLIKSEKSFLIDTALLECVFNKDLEADPLMFGHILENYVAMELVKQLSYKFLQLQLFHYRTTSGEEVDFILEATDGSIIGIEVKSSSQFSEKSVKGLSQLKEQLKDKFKIGVVLYQGTQVLPIEPDIYAVPLAYLWS